MTSYTLFTSDESESQSAIVAYALLGVTVVCECAGTMALRLAVENEWWMIPAYVFYMLGLTVFPRVLTKVSLGVAYSIWCGTGCVLSTTVSTIAFGEEFSIAKLTGLIMVMGGITLMVV